MPRQNLSASVTGAAATPPAAAGSRGMPTCAGTNGAGKAWLGSYVDSRYIQNISSVTD